MRLANFPSFGRFGFKSLNIRIMNGPLGQRPHMDQGTVHTPAHRSPGEAALPLHGII